MKKKEETRKKKKTKAECIQETTRILTIVIQSMDSVIGVIKSEKGEQELSPPLSPKHQRAREGGIKSGPTAITSSKNTAQLQDDLQRGQKISGSKHQRPSREGRPPPITLIKKVYQTSKNGGYRWKNTMDRIHHCVLAAPPAG